MRGLSAGRGAALPRRGSFPPPSLAAAAAGGLKGSPAWGEPPRGPGAVSLGAKLANGLLPPEGSPAGSCLPDFRNRLFRQLRLVCTAKP